MLRNQKTISALLLAAVLLAAIVAALLVLGVLTPEWRRKIDLSRYTLVGPDFEVATYSQLPGWSRDAVSEAVPAFLLSCERLSGRAPDEPFNPGEALGDRFQGTLSPLGVVGDWTPICNAARALDPGDYVDASAYAAAVRSFFEAWFTPVRILNRYARDGATSDRTIARGLGAFTGYFEPVYPARLARSAEFSAPVYTRPKDLVMVDLGAFRDDLAGQRIAGRVRDGALIPYPDHAEINRGALGARVSVIAYMRPDDLFFLQIQGSGRLRLVDEGDREILVGYDGQNGRKYYAIGRSLVKMGVMTPETASMQKIRTWLAKADPADAAALREENPSYVFFKLYDDRPDPALGPYGAAGIQLTPKRSLAVDPRYVGLGAPIYVEIDSPLIGVGGGALMIAQDVGGAIKGPVRGDVYFGSGDAAGAQAGSFNESGALYVLTPKNAAERFFASVRS